MMAGLRPFLVAVLLLNCLLWSCSALKDCMEPLRDKKKDKFVHCGLDFALVENKPICHNNTADYCKSYKNNEGSEVCSFVAESLFADWRMLDGAFWTSGSCHDSIQEGRFYAQDALRVLPDNHEVVGVRIKGESLRQILEEGLVDYYLHGNAGAFPHTAGFKFGFDVQQLAGQRVQNLKVLGFSCQWKEVRDDKSYMILTNTALALTVFGKATIGTNSHTGRGEAESLFLYTTSACTIHDNWHQLRQRHAPPNDIILSKETTDIHGQSQSLNMESHDETTERLIGEGK